MKFGVLFLALLSCGFACQSADQKLEAPAMSTRGFGAAILLAKLSDPAINESSGMARSYRFPGRYYTHNDSGDSARFWRFDESGKTEGPYSLAGASAVDWEDLASVRIGEKSYLYFGDIGDNSEKRKSVQVYRVEEPDSPGSSLRAEVFEITYPDRPHNAEALMVGQNGAITIVTKTDKGPCKVFILENPTPGPSQTMREVGSLSVGAAISPSKLVTGGDFSADGRFAVIRTYVEAYEFDVPKDGAWWSSKPRRIATAAELQGEAITYALDGQSLLTSSEFAPCPISRIPVVVR